MRALTGGSRARADKPKRQGSSSSGFGQIGPLENEASGSTSQPSNYVTAKQNSTSASRSMSSSSTGGERERWFLPRALHRSNTREHLAREMAMDAARNATSDAESSFAQLADASSSRASPQISMASRDKGDPGFVVDRERGTTTRERANDPRKAGLWRLNVDQYRDAPASMMPLAHQNSGAAMMASPSSSPTLPRRKTSSRTDGDNSPSPPSPFSHARSDQSPPTTPPDSVLSGRSGFHKRDLSWTSSNHSPPNGHIRHSPVDGFTRLPPAATAGVSPGGESAPPSKSPSRNDIFTSAQPVLAPAPRISTRIERVPSVRQSTHSSRQSSFFFGPTAENSPVSPALAPPATQAKMPEHIVPADDRPGYIRTSTEERERERQAIQQNNTEIDFRLCPSKEYLLGEGRHSCVYLGSYKSKGEASDEHEMRDWQLCAIKRPFADHQSQLLALEEAFALRRLGPHPNVVRLIKIRDEVGMSACGASQSGSHTQHARSVSDTTTAQQQGEESLASGSRASGASHRRLVSTPLDRPNNCVAAPGTHDSQAAYVATNRDRQNAAGDSKLSPSEDSSALAKATNETPRLLILLELLPYSLNSFTRRYRDQVDLTQWLEWAVELASVVEWLHSRGCIHADLKPENVLLTGDLHVKICDFNSALFPSPSTPLIDGLGLGSPHYGAPELTRGPHASAGKGFGFAVDVWSLGAILYTMATGQEPFKRARSMIDVLYRKRAFFEIEENDRSARLSVAEGSSTAGPGSTHGGGSTTVSRHGSLRGRNSLVDHSSPSQSPQASHRLSMHRRAPSTESVDSVASALGVTTFTGRMPSMRSVNMLLDDNSPIGVILPLGHSPSKAEVSLHRAASDRRSSAHVNAAAATFSNPPAASDNGHSRATSLSKGQRASLLSPESAQRRLRSGTMGNPDSPITSPLNADVNRVRAVENGSPYSKLRSLDGQGSNNSLAQSLSPSQNGFTQSDLLKRPANLNRAASYTDASNAKANERETSAGKGQTRGGAPQLSLFQEQDSADWSINHKRCHDDAKTQREDSDLRLAVTAAFAKSQRENLMEQEQALSSTQPSDTNNGDHSWCDWQSEHNTSVCWDELQPYPDGYPALLLPGGGRLPDAARDLLKRMLSSNPDLRPTAAQVRQGFEALL